MALFKRKPRGNKKKSALGLRLTILLLGVGMFGLYAFYGQSSGNLETVGLASGSDSYVDYNVGLRRLAGDDGDDDGGCKDRDQADICLGFGNDSCKRLAASDSWLLLFVVLGLLYLFVGIAIICDELFVPALEIIAEDLQLSNDVAGATLMAAGGSAPELATSFVGTFKRSDVGFGTIVGSAVFNVLFVIAMCVMFTPEKYSPLQLTWWPLFRDCSYYVVTLACLAVFMMDGEIEIWEAAIQFALYFGYVFFMMNNEKVEAYVENWIKGKDSKVEPGSEIAGFDETIETGKESAEPVNLKESPPLETQATFVRPSTFRVGILQLLTSKNSITEAAGVAFVSKIKGDVNTVFAHIDTNNNGEIDKMELRACLLELGTPEEELTTEKIDECMLEMDKSGNGCATKADFTIWYTRNEQRLKNKVREVFQTYDKESKGSINKSDVEQFMKGLGHQGPDVTEGINVAMEKITGDILTFEQFQEWYESSLFWESEKNAADQAAEAQESMWEGVKSGMRELGDGDVPIRAKISYILTLPLSLLFCLIPDCRPPGMEGKAWFTMIGSVLGIAMLAIVMVELAEIFGATIGIPSVVMGLTILAAGTSVPDLLSSVIVAQQGQGDMAVSSSIGSNIFDVAFGLPLPWLTFNIVAFASKCNCNVMVESDTESLMLSLTVLLVMVAAIVAIIHASDWKMSKNLGYSMFFLYFCYIAFALLTTDSKEFVPEKCSPFNLGY